MKLKGDSKNRGAAKESINKKISTPMKKMKNKKRMSTNIDDNVIMSI